MFARPSFARTVCHRNAFAEPHIAFITSPPQGPPRRAHTQAMHSPPPPSPPPPPPPPPLPPSDDLEMSCTSIIHIGRMFFAGYDDYSSSACSWHERSTVQKRLALGNQRLALGKKVMHVSLQLWFSHVGHQSSITLEVCLAVCCGVQGGTAVISLCSLGVDPGGPGEGQP